jgi:hypothetical protein
VLRRSVLIAALAASLVAPAQAATPRQTLMPGVTYERAVEFTPHGPVVIHVIRAPRPGGLLALKTILSNDRILGTERVSAMQRRASATATVAGVNGDRFGWADGHPSGMLIHGGVLSSLPIPERSSVGVQADGTLRVERVRYAGTWRGTGQRRPVALNRAPTRNGVSLFTPVWGETTPVVGAAVAAVVTPFPPSAPQQELIGPVVQVLQVSGRVSIPAGGAVLLARGTAAASLAAEAPVGTQLTVRLTLTPPAWGAIPEALGGGPVLVRDGKAVFRSNELFTVDQLVPRHPRTAVGQLADGRVVLVAVDGRSGLSSGMTNFEFALALQRLGAVSASSLDGGGSTTMAFDGRILNHPSDPRGERAVANGLFLFYYGVYAPPLPQAAVSTNGDGVAEIQRLAFKLPRAAHVIAHLIGPDRVERVLDDSDHRPGTYRFNWGSTSDPEGSWRFAVEAVDEQGIRSNAERTFVVNRTLGFLRVSPPTLWLRAGRAALASFTLARAATVRAKILTAAGALVRRLPARNLEAGPQSVTWNGRDARGVRVRTGRYRIQVAAQNQIGTVELSAPLAVRR